MTTFTGLPLGSLFQWPTTLLVKNLFLMSSLNFPWCSFIPFPYDLSIYNTIHVLSRSDAHYRSLFWRTRIGSPYSSHWWSTLWHLPCPCLSDLCPEWHSDRCANGPIALHRSQGRDWEDEDGAWNRHFSWSTWPGVGVHSQIWKQESAGRNNKTDAAMPALRQPSKMSVI